VARDLSDAGTRRRGTSIVIITRSPLRISLGGGGTDIPSYYREAGHGFLVAAAITQYIYIAVHRNFDDDVLLKYSKVERVPTAKEANHPLLRACLEHVGLLQAIEISSIADIPAGTGLGSSGAFAVGTLKALLAFQHRGLENTELAHQACHIEINVLGEPVGKQDQYVSAVGGLTAFTFHDDESVEIEPVHVPDEGRDRLEDNLLLFFTGLHRSAAEALALEQVTAAESGISLSTNLDRVRAIGYETRAALERGDMATFGALLSDQWRLKFERAPSPVHREIDSWIARGVEAGAAGGKLVGAGGGGFLLFYAEQKADLRAAMRKIGLQELRFGIDYEGSAVIVSR
jgi:D-glycero-alpha-D-manno-heptose-7-phosphate kinase